MTSKLYDYNHDPPHQALTRQHHTKIESTSPPSPQGYPRGRAGLPPPIRGRSRDKRGGLAALVLLSPTRLHPRSASLRSRLPLAKRQGSAPCARYTAYWSAGAPGAASRLPSRHPYATRARLDVLRVAAPARKAPATVATVRGTRLGRCAGAGVADSRVPGVSARSSEVGATFPRAAVPRNGYYHERYILDKIQRWSLLRCSAVFRLGRRRAR